MRQGQDFFAALRPSHFPLTHFSLPICLHPSPAATLFATKGQYEKGITYCGKGKAGRRFTRKSHVTLALREAREARDEAGAAAMRAAAQLSSVIGPVGRGRRAPKGIAFGVRVVAPAMVAWSVERCRPRFAYRSEV